ncbi:uncharacterized protein DUF2572 [Nicoletella semolina]|uniref:Uncharacterized protein DUF2572 n=1 Tax=Nicoletella semolina TaxID=271160 RepID=A0A4V2SJY3_9PAST|nr:DUF2572 family protein [Nicoletella semolina]MDH2924450.1 hypothetical protein [Nicoletella semolina]TCP17426.1 uncharacterized protein DUF2572 [Nicoletella semolina]
MKKYISSNTVLVSLLMISSLLSVLFINKEKFFSQEKTSLKYRQDYLHDKLLLSEILSRNNEKNLCNQEKKTSIVIKLNYIHYSFHCKFDSIFLQKKPETTKYIQIDKIKDWLNLEKYNPPIVYIEKLSDLPDSSENNPQIVIAKNEISERLLKNFYGIIITDYLFEITGKQVNGTVFSSYVNKPTRYIKSNRKVINNLEKIFSTWEYLPNSRNILANEK